MPRKSARVGSIYFRYEQPEVSISGSSRTVVHEPVGKRPVIQYLGPGSTTVDIHGHCYLDNAQEIQQLNRGGKVRVRTEEFDSMAILEDYDVSPEGARGGVPPNEPQPRGSDGNPNEWRYEYQLELTEVQGEVD